MRTTAAKAAGSIIPRLVHLLVSVDNPILASAASLVHLVAVLGAANPWAMSAAAALPWARAAAPTATSELLVPAAVIIQPLLPPLVLNTVSIPLLGAAVGINNAVWDLPPPPSLPTLVTASIPMAELLA